MALRSVLMYSFFFSTFYFYLFALLLWRRNIVCQSTWYLLRPSSSLLSSSRNIFGNHEEDCEFFDTVIQNVVPLICSKIKRQMIYCESATLCPSVFVFLTLFVGTKFCFCLKDKYVNVLMYFSVLMYLISCIINDLTFPVIDAKLRNLVKVYPLSLIYM